MTSADPAPLTELMTRRARMENQRACAERICNFERMQREVSWCDTQLAAIDAEIAEARRQEAA